MASMFTFGPRAGIEQDRPLRLNPSSCRNFVVRAAFQSDGGQPVR